MMAGFRHYTQRSMYLEYFGFSRFPFTIAPDPDFLYPSGGHQEALAHLHYALTGHGGLICLTGEVGTGKTTLCRAFLHDVPDNVRTAYLFNPQLSAQELLQSLCDELDIRYPADASLRDLYRHLNEGLLAEYAKGHQVICVIDEAQSMPAELLEQIRLLTNLETEKEKLLTLILVGQPELQEILRRYDLRQLNQRITARYHLRHLNLKETADYLSFRLHQAGVDDTLFSGPAIRRLWQASRGVPRIINTLADRALLGAYASEQKQVSVALVKGAEREIFGDPVATGSSRRQRPAVVRPLLLGMAALLILAGVAALLLNRQPALESLLSAAGSPPVQNPVALLSEQQWGTALADCQQVAIQGADCLWVDWPLQQLTDAGAEFVIRVRTPQGEQWQTTLPVPGQQYTGQALIFWDSPDGYQQQLIRPGDTSDIVLWVRQQLGMEWHSDWQVVAPAGSPAEAPDGRFYDPLLARRIMNFQTRYGLTADRIIGPQTLFYLQQHASPAEGS